jgi:hypothetical protein
MKPYFSRYNKKFSSEWFYYVGFFFDHPHFHYDILLTIYEQQTEMERSTGSSFYKNGVGFADGVHSKKFTDLAEKVIEQRKSKDGINLTSKEASDVRLLFHYFPQYFQILQQRKSVQWRMLIGDMIAYSDACLEFEKTVFSLLLLYPDVSSELIDLSGSLKQGKPLSSARKELEKLTNQKFCQQELF